MLQEEILAKYSNRSFISGGESYIFGAYVNNFINDCLEYDLIIIGIEGFKLEGDNLKPLLDAIADFSVLQVDDWDDLKKSCRHLAKIFLEEYLDRENIVWNFSLMDRNCWQDRE